MDDIDFDLIDTEVLEAAAGIQSGPVESDRRTAALDAVAQVIQIVLRDLHEASCRSAVSPAEIAQMVEDCVAAAVNERVTQIVRAALA